MGFLEFLKHNFMHAFPILLCAAFAVAIMWERYMALYKVLPLKDSKAFFDRINDMILQGRMYEALGACDAMADKPMSRIVKIALQRAHLPDESIQSGIEMAMGDAVQQITKRTTFLATLANVTTLLGLFGTVAGLISSFEAVGAADPQQKSALLAAGIATAMNATMMGLAVAIPCMVAFSVLTNRSNRMVAELEEASVRTLDLLKLRYYGEEAKQVSNGADHSKKEKAAA